MTTLVGLVHSGDSIAGAGTVPAIGYFYAAYGWTAKGDQSAAATQRHTTYSSGADLIARNMAVSGTRLNTNGGDDLVPMAPTYIDTIIPVGYAVPPHARTRRYIFTCAIGSNDSWTNATSVASFAAAVAAACVARKTAGFHLAGICTGLPRADHPGAVETARATYNALLRDSSWRAANGIDFLVDLASEATMDAFATTANATYYLTAAAGGGIDGVHPTTAGHALLAPIYAAAVNAAIATL